MNRGTELERITSGCKYDVCCCLIMHFASCTLLKLQHDTTNVMIAEFSQQQIRGNEMWLMKHDYKSSTMMTRHAPR